MNDNPLSRVSLKNPVHFFAVGFGSGLLRPAPGTWGSLAATVLGALLLAVLGTLFLMILIPLGFLMGCYFCEKTAADMGVHDHGSIVWDEFIGVFIVLCALPKLTLPWIIAAFVLFRFFDILKPFPIRYFDQKLRSGFGIMIDDVLAAVYAVIVIWLLQGWL